jgi:hypothetical protein
MPDVLCQNPHKDKSDSIAAQRHLVLMLNIALAPFGR